MYDVMITLATDVVLITLMGTGNVVCVSLIFIFMNAQQSIGTL